MPRFAPRVLGILCCLAAANVAHALPIPRPSSYYGTVTVGGNPVGAGLSLTAEIGGVEYAATTTIEVDGMTVFLIDVPADDPATAPVEGGSEGQTVDFLLDGVAVSETGTWSDGTYTQLSLTAPPGADLAIAKDDGVTDADPGDTLTYTLTISNLNAVDAFGVLVEDTLPVGTTFVSASDGGSAVAGVVSWPVFDLAGSASVSRTLVVSVDNSFPAGTSEIVNLATVATDGSDGIDPNRDDNQAEDRDALAGGPDLAVTKTADLAELRPGEAVTYTLEVGNNGFQDAVDVRLTDVLPPNLIFQTATGEGAILGSLVKWPVFDVAVGATITRTYRVRLDPDVPEGFAQLVNTATVTETNNLELDPTDNTTSLTLPVLQAADLTVLLVDPSGSPIDPQTLAIAGMLSVELRNAGNLGTEGAFDVTIFEDLNGNGTFEAGTDNLLGTATHGPGLPSKENLVIDVPVAGSVSFRNSPLYAFVDSGEVIAEHSEANNIETAASACQAIPTPGDFSPETEIAWPVPGTSESFSRDSASVPLIVQLTDDNGDGLRDENDIPDIVFVSIDLSFPFNPAPRLRAIRGDTGAEIWSAPQISAFWVWALTGAAAGDIDNDGRPEIIVSMISTQSNTGNTNRLAAYNFNGGFRWFSSIYNTHPNGTSLTNRDNPSIADLDQDGVPEIIVGSTVFRNNGSIKWVGAGGVGYQSARNQNLNDSGAISIAADLNLSGGLELVTGNTAYNADGSIQWQIPFDDGYPSIGNFDADPFPEIVVVSRGNVRLHEHDGTLIWGPIPLPGANPEAGGAATIGNFDADPEPEIGVAGSTQYTVFEGDGSIKWQQTIQDGSSNMTGSTVFDFDGDGLAEVVYRDEVFLRIFRGTDGVVLYQEAIGSFTANEEAVVADVDNDGNAEIIISSNQTGTRGLRVIGDANDNWVAARGAWNQHQYHIDNINDDGSIPQFEQPGWQTHNTYRANIAPAVANPFIAPDLSASQLLVDLSAFPAATVTARIGNGGSAPAADGISVAFYDGDPGVGGNLLGTTSTTSALAVGEFEDVSIGITLPGLGAFPIFVVADDDGTGQGQENECDELNNQHDILATTEDLGLVLDKDDGITALAAGDETTYLLTITNSNTVDRNGVVLSDTLPPDTFFVAASDGGTEAGGVVTWPAFTLAADATVQRTLTIQVDPAIPVAVTSITNTAAVTDDGSVPDPTPGNNTAADTNQVLSVRADAGGPYAGDEGSPIVFDGSASSDRDGTIVLYEWDFENDGTFDDTGVSPSHTYPDDGSFTILLKVTDDSGEMDTDTAEATVANVEPAVEAGADQTAGVGEQVAVSATFTDPGTADTHTAEIDWGDGTMEPGTVDQGAGTVSGSHAYGSDGLFTVEVCVTDDDGATGCDTFTVDISGAPVLAASKIDSLAADNDGDAVPSPGDVIGYDITIANSGNATATGVVLTDMIPANTAVVAGSLVTSQGVVDSEDPVQVSVGEIAPAGTVTVSFQVTIDNPVPAGVMDIVNQGTVTSVELPAVLTDDPDLGGTQDPTATMIVAAPDLVAEKTDALAVDADGDTVPSPGDTLEYTVTLLNNGNTSATAVVLSDPVPLHTTMVAGTVTTSQGVVDSEDPVQVTLGEIAGGGATVTITFRVLIDDPVAAGVDEVVNQGTVTSAELAPVPTDDPDLGGNADPTATMIVAAPDLVVEKVDVLFADGDGDGVASPGDELLYQITIDNFGNTSATAVVLTDPIPLATTVVAGTVQSSQGVVVSEDPVEVDLGEIAGGASATVSFRVGLDDPFPATELGVANQASVASAELPGVPSDDPDTPVAADPTATEVFITPAISIADATATEVNAAASGLDFALTLSVAPNREVRVDYATADSSAVAGADYVADAGTVVFAAGETAGSIVVLGLDDLLDEPDETFTVELAGPVNATLGDAQGLGTILDDDVVPVLAIDDVSVVEGDAGSTAALFTVSLSALSAADVSVDFATADGTALAGVDYVAAAGTVVIPAGVPTASIPVDVLGDLLDEADETFTVELTNPVNAALADVSGLGTILDDDDPPAVAVDDVTVVEGDAGSTAALFTVSLSALSAADVSVDFATADGTALAGVDYVAAAGTVVIPAGVLTASIPVDVLGDLLDEADETFMVELTNPVNAALADASGLGTILDDDDPPAVAIDDVTVVEGDAGSTAALFTVSLSAPSGLDVTVDFATADGTAVAGLDYTAAAGGLTIAAGEVSGALTVDVLGDLLDEADETFTVDLANPANATLGDAQGLGIVLDDDDPPVLAIDDVTVVEGDAGVTAAVFTVTLSAPSGLDVTVDFATADGTAVAGLDYTAAAGSLTIAAGEVSGALTVDVLGDLLDEADETFTVDLANPANATLGDAQGLGIVLDDDDPPVLAIDDVTVVEGDAGVTAAVFTVTLSAPSGLDVTVDFATADGTAVAGLDYTAAAGSLTIAAGEVSGALTVDVLGDLLGEADETFTVGLADPANATLGDAEGLGTILDDDDAREISIADAAVAEGDTGTVDLVFVVSLSSAAPAPVSVDFATADGTALAGEDYLATSGTLSLAAGASDGTIAVPVVGDLVLEPDESLVVELSNPMGGVVVDGVGEGVILDDEECPGPNLIDNPGAEMPLEAGELPGWTEVVGTDWQPRFDNPLPAEGVAYFFAGPVPLGELRQDVDVLAYSPFIAAGDQEFRFEGLVRTFDEMPADTARIVVEYRDAANAVVLDVFDSGEIVSPLAWQLLSDERPAPVGTGWIRVRLIATRLAGADNDGYFDALSLVSLRTPVVSVSDVAVGEGDAGTVPALFTLRLNCPLAEDVTVDVRTADGTATAGEDYVALAPMPVVLAAGTSSAEVTIDVLGDVVEEDDETFFLDLSAPQNAAVVDGRGVGTILDDDGVAFCPRSHGFWKTHLDEWPVTELELGGVLYGQDTLLSFLKAKGPDASLKLARQLVATKLNLASGSDRVIQPVVDEANAFLAVYPPGSRPRGGAAKLALTLAEALDEYNNDPRCHGDDDSDSDADSDSR